MNTRFLITVASVILLSSCSTTKTTGNDLATTTPIESQINLTKVKNDKVPVTIDPGRFTIDTVTYYIPKTVPGTYQLDDYGQYIDGFKAYDYNGHEMKVEKPDINSWKIVNAKQLDKISYLVNDTYDIEQTGGIGDETPFSPAGTNIEPNNYVLNLHGFIGYFNSLKNNQYKVDVTAPTNFVKSTALQQTGSIISPDGKSTTTSYVASRYFDITDNPMMYGKLTVEEFQVGDIKIVLSVYSPNNLHSAASLKDAMYKMMKAQKAFLGDMNTTSRYDIFLYLSEGKKDSPKGYGALEHNKSTMVVFPEDMSDEELADSMIETVAHEFFHIVTPLTVHSEDIQYFDYNKPTFSKQLWMYEGVTEYFANLFQVNQGLISEDEFYKKIMDKIEMSLNMYDDTMSFTKMSEHVDEEPYKSQYANVYQKGALIGMCIDILMREESHGQRGILSLMKELSHKYGANKPFDDDKLIDEITAMTYPSVGEFLKTHVVGTTPINYEVFFQKVGLELVDSKVETNFILNGSDIIVGGNRQYGTIFFTDLVKDNSFWNDLGVQPRDIIKSVNGTKLTMQNADSVMQDIFSWKPGQDIEVVLNRKGEDVIIKAKTVQSYTAGNVLKADPKATEAQIKLREAWLKG
ncbi:M61 family metallopeptidase [Yeosuana marina]|uniref:M61 family metallopeptidase n=1 Tax=Yeosuana marina TaxID=1565536 RepID=UPI00141FB2FC|nr:peptidase M61 [Yeosuana marina]